MENENLKEGTIGLPLSKDPPEGFFSTDSGASAKDNKQVKQPCQ